MFSFYENKQTQAEECNKGTLNCVKVNFCVKTKKSELLKKIIREIFNGSLNDDKKMWA